MSTRKLFAVTLMLLTLITGQAVVPPQSIVAAEPVEIGGTVTEARNDTEGGCEKYTLLLWSAVQGAVSYTVDMHDTWGYSFVATFPPYQYDAAFGWLPAVSSGQHRHALTYQGGGVGGCQANDVARYTIRSLVANYNDTDGRIVGTVRDEDGNGIESVAITIAGPSGSTQQTNAFGAYGTNAITKGNYTVTAPSGYCVRGGATCSRSKSVNVQGPTSVNFVKASGDGTITGTVTERTCTEESCTEAGLPGVLVSADGPDGGEQVTGDDGTYSITVGTGTYEVTPVLDEREFDPPSKSVEVDAGDTETADFATCAEAPEAPEVARTTVNGETEPIGCEKLRISWTMPPHIRTAGWNDSPIGSNYVNPAGGWRVNLFVSDATDTPVACAANRTWTWKATLRGSTETATYRRRDCKFSPKLPSEGVYNVEVEELRKSDNKVMAKGSGEVVVQDFLIIGLGDSNASGQGNPPFWNRQCDRSEESYQMQAAEKVERADSKTSVTFVHLACSGARTVHIAENSYVGQEPGQGRMLPPQLVQLRRILREGQPVREIDSMIVSAGINDLRFGSIVAMCLGNDVDAIMCQDLLVRRAKDEHGEPTFAPANRTNRDGRLKNVVAQEITNLPAKLSRMARLMAQRVTIDPSRILLTQYPDESWRSAGVLCDNTSGYFPRLRKPEWRWLSEAAHGLNTAVANGPFTAITGIPELFVGHGYCTEGGRNWFRGLFDSGVGQWNRFGTFHATRDGHVAMAREVAKTLCQQLFNGASNCKGTAREPEEGSLP